MLSLCYAVTDCGLWRWESEVKGLVRKRLDADGDVSLNCRLRVKKVEADLLHAMVDERRNRLGPKVASIGAAVVALLRIALNCLRDHRWSYQSEEPLQEAEAIQEGLRVLKGKRKAKRGK